MFNRYIGGYIIVLVIALVLGYGAGLAESKVTRNEFKTIAEIEIAKFTILLHNFKTFCKDQKMDFVAYDNIDDIVETSAIAECKGKGI